MMKRIGACLLAVAMIMTVLAGFAVAETTKVTRCDARLRKQNNTSSDTLIVVPGGTDLVVLGTSGGWTKTTYKGHTGYVATELLMELTRSGYYPLKEGDENPYVTEVQKRLIELGYMSGSSDGTFGATTKTAVMAFQKAHRMTQDGIAGGETQKLMFSSSAKAASGETMPSSTAGTTTPTTTTQTASATTLKNGSRGDDVKTLQARLIELGYLSGKADGIYGSSTEKAIYEFQKRSNLTADGKAGKVTQNLIYSTGAKTASGTTLNTNTGTTTNNTSYATYKKGMTNDGVKKMQQRLKELGYMSAGATGYFGSATYEAVQKFQSAHNLKSDGIAGTATQQALFATTAKAAGSSSTPGTSTQSYATLKEGMKSSAVTTMQKKLKTLGYMSASATGYFGSATKTAVIAFQKGNNLTADGVAGNATLNKLYGDSAISSGSSAPSGSGSSGGAGKIEGPSSSSVKLLHWFNEVKPSLKSSSVVQVYDPVSGYGFKIKALSLGRHFDSEPLTAEDTSYMNAAFGGVTTWTPKTVWVKLPTGTWTLATMHNTPHLSGSISNNHFDGHLCIHFLRDMDECKQNDPNYGVQHQNAIRAAWKALTGITVP